MCVRSSWFVSVFFFNDTATTEIYTLSLHDALPICEQVYTERSPIHHTYALDTPLAVFQGDEDRVVPPEQAERSEEHTSELQSRQYLVCRLLLEKKTKNDVRDYTAYVAHHKLDSDAS